MDSFTALIERLGGPAVVAPIIRAKPDTVRKMAERNSVRPEYWQALIDLAREKRIAGITHAALIKFLPPRKKRAA